MTIDHAPPPHCAARATGRVVPIATLHPTPWRNGGGMTRRIATGGADGSDPDWTLSLADIETACQFSTFPGLARTAVVVGDDPVDLTVNGATRTLALLDRISFTGDHDVRAAPTRSATRLLNLMTRSGVWDGALSLRHLRGTFTLDADDVVAHMVLAGSLIVGDDELRRWDTILLADEPIEVTGAATVAAVHIRPSTTPTTPASEEDSE